MHYTYEITDAGMKMSNETTDVCTIERKAEGEDVIPSPLGKDTVRITVKNDTEFEINAPLFPYSRTFTRLSELYRAV